MKQDDARKIVKGLLWAVEHRGYRPPWSQDEYTALLTLVMGGSAARILAALDQAETGDNP